MVFASFCTAFLDVFFSAAGGQITLFMFQCIQTIAVQFSAFKLLLCLCISSPPERPRLYWPSICYLAILRNGQYLCLLPRQVACQRISGSVHRSADALFYSAISLIKIVSSPVLLELFQCSVIFSLSSVKMLRCGISRLGIIGSFAIKI